MLDIIISNSSMIPIYEQIVSQIKNRILQGALLPDAALPSVRAMAAELRISALTVKKAYDLLESEGYVTTVHGKGTFVTAANQQLLAEQRRRTAEDAFAAAIDKARACGMEDAEIREIVDILLEDTTPRGGGRL